MVKLLSKRADIGFTTGGHTGDDVFLYSYGPQLITGLVDNTDLAKEMASFMGFDLTELTNDLYINAEEALQAKGFTTTIDLSDKNNPVLVANKGKKTYHIPENKDYILLKGANGKRVLILFFLTNTINVYNDTGILYFKRST